MEKNKDYMNGYDQGWLDCEKFIKAHFELIPIDEMIDDLCPFTGDDRSGITKEVSYVPDESWQ